MGVVRILALLVFLLPLGIPPGSAASAAEIDPLDWEVAGLHFFTQTSGAPGKGYAITDDADARMLITYHALGGELRLGYPISGRYEVDGQVYQAFQKAIVRWNKEADQAEFVTVFDDLSRMGRDAWLWNTHKVPQMANWSADAQRPQPDIVLAHQAKLDTDPAMKELYFSVEDPVALFGLPMSDITDIGDYAALRLQRAVFQKWKKDSPWAAAGTVTVALGGDIARAAGLIPAAALQPVAPEEALDGERWIDVNLTEQTTTAYEGIKPLYVAVVATGVPGLETPKGDWRIFSRVANETMRGADYFLTGVLFTQYFTSWGVAIHYNYWTPDEQFGNRAGSHGCVGMRYDDALYFWEFANIGTRVTVHD